MIICAILTWGKDLLIKPVSSFNEVKNLKNRLRLENVDFIVYHSGFFTPIKFDNSYNDEILESEQVELFGNRPNLHPAWD